MTSNYYTLLAVVREIGPELGGARFLEAYSHRANELRLRFDRGTLVAVLRSIDGALFWSRRPEERPKSNALSFFSEIAGEAVKEVTVSESDRSVVLRFSSGSLTLTYYGSPNATLVTNSGRSAFKKLAEGRESDSAPESQRSFAMLGKRYERELAKDTSLTAETLDAKVRASNRAFIHRKGDEILLALVRLRHLNEWTTEEMNSVNDAVLRVIIERTRLRRRQRLRTELVKRLEAELDRLQRVRADMRRGVEHSNRAERFTAIANAILMVAYALPKGASEAVLDIEERPEKIALDPELSAYENATRYFDRAKRAQAGKEELRVRTKEIAEKIEHVTAMIDQAKHEEELSALERLWKQVSIETDALVPRGDLAPSFREFTVAGGIRVLVGKNAKQNDELTMHVAKKEDLWLHARGVPGSHVILQAGKRASVPKEAIEQAAEIAAFYSDARSQGVAPVSYTPRKYVRKPKGAAPGAVTVEREEVIMVRPQIRGRETS